MTPFRLVYGLEAVVPMEFVVPSLRVATKKKLPIQESLMFKQHHLNQLEEDRATSAYVSEIIQNRMQAWVNRNIKFKIFKEGDWVMLYNSNLGPHPSKLKLRYIGPYRIERDLGQGTFMLSDVFGTMVPKVVNGFRLKPFVGQPPRIQSLFLGQKSVKDQVRNDIQSFSLDQDSLEFFNLNDSANISRGGWIST